MVLLFELIFILFSEKIMLDISYDHLPSRLFHMKCQEQIFHIRCQTLLFLRKKIRLLSATSLHGNLRANSKLLIPGFCLIILDSAEMLSSNIYSTLACTTHNTFLALNV